MPIQNVKLIDKKEVATETTMFLFSKPDGFDYIAGQFGEWTVLNPSQTDDEGNTRAFSYTSAPDEGYLAIATRLRDTAFKRVLHNLPIGTEIKMDGPYGNFTLHKSETIPAVFLTGGIGITPVRSIISHATRNKLPHKIILFYSNKTSKDIAFFDDFSKFADQNQNFTFIPVMTRLESGQWNYEKGRITKEMLIKYVPNMANPIYYLSGSVSMVKVMEDILVEAQVHEDNIRTDEFSGY